MRFKNKRFYKSEEEFQQFYFSLKQTACPHCKLSGNLNLHGYLRGYDEKSCSKRIIRGHRIFCCGRNKRRGCGRTFSVLDIKVLKKFIIRARSLWTFLENITKGIDKKNSIRLLRLPFSDSSAYRLSKRFYLAQSKIRAFLSKLCNAPVVNCSRQPTIQTILHLKAAFKHDSCPIAAFQGYFQTDFL